MSYNQRMFWVIKHHADTFGWRALWIVLLLGSSSAYADALAVGITEPLRQITLSMSVSGVVEKRSVSEGSQVAKGDVLLELDRTIEALEMDSKRLIFEDQSAIHELKERIRILEHQIERGRALVARGGISEKQIEDEILALTAARAELESRTQSKRREQIDHALAQTYFERRLLVAPIQGIVTAVNISVGETVKPQEPLITLVDVSRIKFRGTFSVADRTRFAVGDVAQLTVQQYGQQVIKPAIVSYIAPVADPSSGLIEIIAEADNHDGLMTPGTTAELTVASRDPLS